MLKRELVILVFKECMPKKTSQKIISKKTYETEEKKQWIKRRQNMSKRKSFCKKIFSNEDECNNGKRPS